MLKQLRQTTASYSRPFWLVFAGLLINASGSSMVWPFLTIFMRQQLGVPLTTIGLLLSLRSAASMLSTMIAGSVVDRFGRKIAMVGSLLVGAGNMLLMSRATTLGSWIGLMILTGLFSPLFRVGAHAMIADLVEPERRPSGYALIRMASNLGVAIGPSVGGFVTSVSYSYVFYAAATAQLLVALLIFFLIPESAPAMGTDGDRRMGYGPVFRDQRLLSFVGVFILGSLAASLMMVLLPVYAKENFGVPEHQYGFIMATNAAMVVTMQFAITRLTRRYRPLMVVALGSLFYGIGVGSIALGASFGAFLASMVVVTIGEMVMVPTSTAFAANLAPVEMRGRYMGIYTITWEISSGIGPVIGGLLNDHISPASIWHGGLLMGLVAALGFVILQRSPLFAGHQASEISAAGPPAALRR